MYLHRDNHLQCVQHKVTYLLDGTLPFFSRSHYYLRLSKPRSETPSQHIQIEFCYGLVKLLYIKNAVQIKYIKSNAYIYVCVFLSTETTLVKNSQY